MIKNKINTSDNKVGAPSNGMDKIVNLCKRRGFIFPGSEIYGGFANSWDYGPLGVELKNNVKREWWRSMIYDREDVVGLDSAILMNPKTWEASGHLKNFTDPLVECKKCHHRFRVDQLSEDHCPNCEGQLTPAKQFNLMFKTFIGPAENSSSAVYLRPETAQGIFADFKEVLASSRRKIPFGIAQIGKAFRNEITPGNFIFRTREFEQMELEFFVKPGTNKKWHQYWVKERLNWYLNLGINKKNIRIREHGKEELAHYSAGTSDIEYNFPFGWGELEGIADRSDYDLKQHQEFSGQDLSYYDEDSKEKYLPYVIEPSAGADRSALAFLLNAYTEEKDEPGETRIVLKLNPRLAPVKAAVLPLVKNKKTLVNLARKVFEEVKKSVAGLVQYDEVGSIGRRYRRQDEIGTPYCFTVDFDSLKKKDVTLRDRDTMKQKRIKIGDFNKIFQSIDSRNQ